MCWETTANWMGRLGVQCALLCAGEGVLDCRLCCPQTHAHAHAQSSRGIIRARMLCFMMLYIAISCLIE